MKTVPEIYKFETKMEEHGVDLARQNMILRRFDELIADKASKENMHDVAMQASKRYALIDDFQKTKKETNEIVTKNTKNIAEMQVAMDILGKQITKDIFTAVKKATSHL